MHLTTTDGSRDDDMPDEKLLETYHSLRREMWAKIEEKLGVPWERAENRIFDLGKKLAITK